MFRSALLTIVLLITKVCAAGTTDVIRTAAELKDALYDHPAAGRPYDLTVSLIHVRRTPQTIAWAVRDESGAAILTESTRSPTLHTGAVGDQMHISGETIHMTSATARNIVSTLTRAAHLIGHTTPDPVPEVLAQDILAGRYDCQPVRVTGTIRDAFETEDNPHWEILVLVCNGEVLTVSLPHDGLSTTVFADLIGATISLTALVVPSDNSPRRQLGRILTAAGPGDITILNEATETRVTPDVESIAGNLRPAEIAALDRHRAVGRVLATWQDDTFLLRTATRRLVRVELARGELPPVGSTVEAVGFPESDLYRVNLARARWMPTEADIPNDEQPLTIKSDDIVTTQNGRTLFRPERHGQLVRLNGIIRSLPDVSGNGTRLQVDCDGLTLPVEGAAAREILNTLEIGTRLRLTAICVLESENWRPNAVFPRIRTATLVLRSPRDLEILARPSRFTAARLLAALGVVSAVLLIILVWNFALRRQSERRARKLTQEAIARAESDLKVEERTRLAVELHDSVAQNLTGVAMELEAARQYEATAPDELCRHLDVAWNTLRSCRGELRNCLWDLRSRALEEADMNESIRRMLLPNVKGLVLKIRFAIPRDVLSDNTAHAVLRIIRELTVNGMRHGHATEVAIAGTFERDELSFSVRDNGSGFNPDTAPGATLGHFGLEGIRERVRALGGTFEIVSTPGLGTKATVRIPPPQENANHG